MARVTVEDCITRIPNRFDLVMLAAQRARDISAGAPLTVERDNDKNPVVALREIAEATIDIDHLTNSLIQDLQKHVEVDEPEEEGGFGAGEGEGDLLSDLMQAARPQGDAGEEPEKGEEALAEGEDEAPAEEPEDAFGLDQEEEP